MLRYEDFQYTFRNVGSEFKSCVRLEISWQEKADMTEKFKSKYNSATAEKALPVGKQPAQQQPDAACQPGNEWVFQVWASVPLIMWTFPACLHSDICLSLVSINSLKS